MAKKAVQFGAGNIGRGFLGQLYFETGYHTTFVDVVDEVVREINTRHGYPVRIVDNENTTTLHISGVSAVHARDQEAVAKALAEADLGSTAVGVAALPKVAPLIAGGIATRFERKGAAPLNLIVCENLLDAGPYLREEVRKHLEPRFHEVLDKHVGFVEASIGRMVPVMTEAQKAEDPLLVCVEPYSELPVDVNGFRGPVPELKNMAPRSNFAAYVERKLFVHNLSHAIAAYLGYLHSHEYIWQAIQDPAIRAKVDAALEESCAGLAARHGLKLDALQAHAQDLMRRYQNRGLGDQVARIAKDPLRKLGPRDRLIGAGLMCLEQNVEPEHIALGSAAAIVYDHPGDPEAQELQELRTSGGLDAILSKVCRLQPSSRLAQLIRTGLARLTQEGWLAK